MTGRAFFSTLFALAASIAVTCLGVAYITLSILGRKSTLMVAFAFVLALVVFSAASLVVHGYRKYADIARAKESQ